MVVRIEWLALGADVKLLAQVRLPASDLRGRAVIAAKVRRIEHAHRQLVGLGQGEERARLLLHFGQQRWVDPMTGEVEKPDMPRRQAQLVEELLALLRAAIELRQVEQGQRGDGLHVGHRRLAP